MRCVAQAIVILVLVGASPAITQETIESLKVRATQGDQEAQQRLAGCLKP